jgi:hypothetical protein
MTPLFFLMTMPSYEYLAPVQPSLANKPIQECTVYLPCLSQTISSSCVSDRCTSILANKDDTEKVLYSKESFPLVYLAWRAGTSSRVVVPARQAKYAGGIDSLESNP